MLTDAAIGEPDLRALQSMIGLPLLVPRFTGIIEWAAARLGQIPESLARVVSLPVASVDLAGIPAGLLAGTRRRVDQVGPGRKDQSIVPVRPTPRSGHRRY